MFRFNTLHTRMKYSTLIILQLEESVGGVGGTSMLT